MARELAPPRSKMRRLVAADRVAHWRFDEASGATIADDAGNSPLTSAVTTNIVDGPFIGDAVNRGRTFGSGTQATGTSTAGQRAALLAGNWTIEVWGKPTSVAGVNAVVGHGSNAAGDANNYLASLRLDGSTFGAFWSRTSSKTAVQALTSASPVVVGELQHWAARCRATGATREVSLFHNGVLLDVIAGLDPPTGGSTGSWEIGALNGSHGSPYDGDLYEIRVSGVALDDDAIRDSWARGVREYDHATLYASGHYEVYGRALIDDGAGGWIDLSDWFGVDWIASMEWNESVDDQGVSGSLSLRREIYDLSTVPTRSASALNATMFSGELLRLMARVRLEVAVVPIGTGHEGLALADWLPVFRGFAVGIDSSSDPVKVDLFDDAAALQDVWIEPDRLYTPPRDRGYGTDIGTPVEPELQQIVDDNTPPTVGYRGGAPRIYTPTTSAVNVRSWTTAPSKNVLSALEDVVTQFGWDIRYTFDDRRQEPRLTFAEPPRSASWVTGSPVVDAGLVLERSRLQVIRDDIRNVIEVEYGDEDPDHKGTIKRLTVVVENAASIARFGRRYCRIGLATGDNQVTDLAGATAVANMVLSDLSWPLADTESVLLFRHDLVLGDVVKHLADGIHFDDDLVLATVGVQNRLEAGSARTTLVQRGSVPSGKRWKWFEVTTATTGAASTKPPQAPAGLSAAAILGGARISWDLPPFRGNRRHRETEVHWSTTNGFTPTGATLRERLRGASALSIGGGMTPGVTHYVRIGHVDDMGNVSDWSAQTAVVPRSLPASANVRAYRSTSQVLATGAAYQTIVWNTEVVDALGRHSTATGEYTALSAGLLDVEAVALIDTLLKPGSAVRLGIYVNGVQRFLGDVVVSPGGTPDRVSAEVRRRILVAAGDAVTVRVSSGGNAGHFVVSGLANSYAWFTPITED